MLLKPGFEKTHNWLAFSGADKVIHVSIFALLGYLLYASYPKIKLLYYLYIILIYAFLTEIAQEEMHLGRTMETLDIAADFFGCLIGLLVYLLLKKRFL